MRLVLASGNCGKLRELGQLLAPLDLELIAQDELGVEPVEETGASFEANALLKARHAAAATGLPTLADDSGLEVDALGGAPGIHSARYAGGAGDAANRAQLLAALRDVPAAARGARFRCVLALVRAPGDPAPLLAHGAWEGRIALAERGASGFGYDPLFEVPDLGRTAAELEPAEKDARSHRGQALAALLLALRAQPLA